MFDDGIFLTYKRQVRLIAIGALIGFLPAFANTWVQSRFQRQNIIMSRRLELIQGLSSVNAEAGSILARTINLQTRVDSFPEGTPTVQDEHAIVLQLEKVNEDELTMVSRFKTQMIAAGALYDKDFTTPGPEWVLTPFSPKRPKVEALAKMHDELETDKANLVSTMNHIQHICKYIAESARQ